MKRIRINTTFEEDEEERRQFFLGLTYSERLRYHFELREMFNFHKHKPSKGRVFIIHQSTKLENGI
jgi:predicted RNA methylase